MVVNVENSNRILK